MNQHQYQAENQDAETEAWSQSVFQVRSILLLLLMIYLIILEISLICL